MIAALTHLKHGAVPPMAPLEQDGRVVHDPVFRGLLRLGVAVCEVVDLGRLVQASGGLQLPEVLGDCLPVDEEVIKTIVPPAVPGVARGERL